jgi:hypothetical protein
MDGTRGENNPTFWQQIQGNVKWDLIKFVFQPLWSWVCGIVAVGAVTAHAWLQAQPAGFYVMFAMFTAGFCLPAAPRIFRPRQQTVAPARALISLLALPLVLLVLFVISRMNFAPSHSDVVQPQAPITINQKSTNSSCSNIVANGKNASNINCSSDQEKGSAKKNPSDY